MKVSSKTVVKDYKSLQQAKKELQAESAYRQESLKNKVKSFGSKVPYKNIESFLSNLITGKSSTKDVWAVNGLSFLMDFVLLRTKKLKRIRSYFWYNMAKNLSISLLVKYGSEIWNLISGLTKPVKDTSPKPNGAESRSDEKVSTPTPEFQHE